MTQSSPTSHPPTVPPGPVAVLGLGAMGWPMATRLAAVLGGPAAPVTVRGYDVVPARRDALRAGSPPAGTSTAEVVDTAAAAVAGARVVLLAVRDGAQLQDVLWGPDGVADHLTAGTVVVLTSTVGREAVTAVAVRLAEAGLRFVDAPVSGGPVRAGLGDLLITVGADDDAFAAAGPVLAALAGTLTRVGSAAGDGQSMKTVNQLLCGVHIAAAAEALTLARALGLDPAAALETLQAGAAASFMLADRGPRMLQADDPGGAEVRSRLDIFVKDMGLVAAAARTAQVPTPVAAAAEQLYRLGQAHGLAAVDDSAVIGVLAPPAPAEVSAGGSR